VVTVICYGMLSVLLLILKVAAVIFASMQIHRHPVIVNISTSNSSAMTANTDEITTTPHKGLAGAELTTFTSSVKLKHENDEITGYVQGEYPCIWQNYNGSLLAGSKAVVFTGSFFLFEKTLILQWDDIRKVLLTDSVETSAASGLEIVLNDDTVHAFVNLHAPDKVWLMLMTLQNDALLGRNAQQHTSTPRIKRRNSDPASSGSFLLSSPIVEADEQHATPTVVLSNNNGGSRPVVSTVKSMAESVPQDVIEQATGKLKLQPIQCKHAGVAGRLYSGEAAVFFTGKRYFWEHLVVTIPWSTIRQIQILEKTSASGISSTPSTASPVQHQRSTTDACIGLTIVTRESAVRTDGTTADDTGNFQFCDMETPDKVWASLIALHNENLTATPPQPPLRAASNINNRRKSLWRLNSDPMMGSHLNFEYFDDVIGDTDEIEDVVEHTKPVGSSADIAAAAEVGRQNHEGQAHADAWATVTCQDSYKDSYPNLVIDGHVLADCGLDRFFDMFIADNAEYSLSRFLEGRGDFDLRSTEWKDAAEDECSPGNKKKRVVQYMHPVNAPLAPPQAGARKEQTVSLFGDYGILIETQTFVDDVPMADCFYVADRIRVEPANKEAVTVTMEFGINFMKSTMFKGIIKKKTTSEFTALSKAMAQYMSDALAGAMEEPKATTGGIDETMIKATAEGMDETVKAVETAVKTKRWQQLEFERMTSIVKLDRLVVLVILLLQFWILAELRGIKRAMLLLDRSAANGHCGANEY
jgi:VAD1 Analog of StAR-related lipid transfer domain